MPIKVAVLYGGKSTEHEVSVHSAQTVCRTLSAQPEKYTIYPIFISKEGFWYLQQTCGFLTAQDKPVTPVIAPGAQFKALDGSLSLQADVVFPVVHGTNCEDGTLQGLLETLNVPYVGCGVFASAAGMDKEACKLLAAKAGISVLPYRVISRAAGYDKTDLENWVRQTGLPVFVKPVRLGSSVGITKVTALDQLHKAARFALQFDTDAMVEKGIDRAREIFCAVLGAEGNVQTSACGELRQLAGEFFDYNAKYLVQGGCETKVPADILPDTAAQMRRDTAVVFNAIHGSGLARVDFLMDGQGRYFFSEINTIPGMSETSLFPQLFEASGLKYEDALDRLISLAREEHRKKQTLCLSR